VTARVGAYKLLDPIGEGGMGRVFLAERDDAAYQRKVAVKVLRHGLEGKHGIARFRDERQILAALDHPGIVKLLDGGTTEDGLPYLVMDHVAGVPITRFADDRALGVRERLALFRGVCSAVQYAHQRLVVHRDLKPSNILVDESGAAKLLDFGIAKLIDPASQAEARTHTGTALLTPEYASPEQARGEAVSAATDVYSLGALLYELLTGAPPLRASGSALETLRVICEVEPPRPSTACPQDRRKAVAGDLDNIVLKALHKDPARRYPSVQHLDDDLSRHLDGLPVRARDATWTYRAAKFARRNRGKIALGAAAAVALGTLAVYSVSQARRADDQAARAKRRFDEVRKLAHSLVFEVDDKIRDLEGSTAARELVVTRALEYLDGLSLEAGDDSALSLELATAYMKIGDIQGNAYDPNLGHPEQGLESYRKASLILARLPRDHTTDAARVAELYGEGGLYYTLGRAAPATDVLDRAVAGARALPEGTVESKLVMRGYAERSQVGILAADIPSAVAAATEGIAFAQRWRERAHDPDALYWHGIGYEVRGDAQLHSGAVDLAIADLRAACADYAALVKEHPDDARYVRERYVAQMRLASALGPYSVDTQIWAGHIEDPAARDEAIAIAIEVAQHVNESDRVDARSATELGAIFAVRGASIGDRSPREGLQSLDLALAIWAGMAPDTRASHYVRQLEWFTHLARGLALARLGRRDEAFAETESGLAVVAEGKAGGLEDEWIRAHYLAGKIHALAGDPAAAATLLDAAFKSLDARITAKSTDIGDYLGITETAAELAALRPADACQLHARVVEAWRNWTGPTTPFVEQHRAAAAERASHCHG